MSSTTKTLTGTCFEFVYPLTSSNSDQQFLSRGTTLVVIVTLTILIYRIFQRQPFPYGKGKDISDENSIFTQLVHFYPLPAKFAWKYSFFPTIIIPLVLLPCTPALYIFYPKNAIAFIIAYVHCLYRTIIYSSKISTNAHTIGIFAFIGMFLVHVIHTFYVFHGIINVLPPESFTVPVGCGAIISFVGARINHYHDGILTQLRSKGKGYRIPEGGLFEWVSCANYFGEVVEWWGLALVTRAGPEVMFAIWSTIMLGLRADDAQKFYEKTFPNKYPVQRKRIIPFIY